MASLMDAVTMLPSVGPKRESALRQLGIVTVGDLLFYFPFRYDDIRTRSWQELGDGEKVTLKGTVIAPPVLSRFGRNRNRLSLRLLVEDLPIVVTFFNQPWLKDKIEENSEVAVFGTWNAKRHSLAGQRLIAQADGGDAGMSPIYSVNKHIRQRTLVDLIHTAYEKYHGLLREVVPDSLRTHYRLEPTETVVHNMHFPKNGEEARLARRSAAFRELFLFECRMQSLRRDNNQVDAGLALDYDLTAMREFIKTLPFELTSAQKRVVNELCADMKRAHHMNRLLQGDVGSGKTIVAVLALFAAVTAGYQAALMVPTEILAEQHYTKIAKLLAPMHVTVGILTGSLNASDRAHALHDIETGRMNVIIGTHALIQDTVKFAKLGLAIIDEQHRFGVNQRRALRQKGINPDVLMMTATPIPRTLAITTYGEMDVSTIDELPAGRQPIATTWLKSNQTGRVLTQLKTQLATGAQAYVVTPLIAESEAVDLRNAEDLYERMQRALPEYHVALLHGQLKNQEKNAIMGAFSRNEVQVLVATTVVEVGMDVPNANMMIIFDADRFGLSQLHQLRGRVGRGNQQAFCYLIADPKNQVAIARMEAMVKTTDGFVLAEKDLQLRGPGDVFGDEQSGLPHFNVADPVGDSAMLEVAHDAAKEIFQDDPSLAAPDHAGIASYLAELKKRNQYFD
ncbi:ATP-dependent DNA helicase RecG [Schleiferilactobacillus perolens]|uniref:ATP-dependent DNA helicase RecG n=1 Tax=Schleiferilactobacillus perolens TaxID=100468 RepID=UPI002355D04A|nr:ATP-dependent DNA helicase RecG [Schleiferilactobacillus perolens]